MINHRTTIIFTASSTASTTVILSNFRKTRTKDRIVSNRIVSYRIVSNRIVSNRIFFKNAERETANQIVELISNTNFGIKLTFSNKYYKVRIFNFYS